MNCSFLFLPVLPPKGENPSHSSCSSTGTYPRESVLHKRLQHGHFPQASASHKLVHHGSLLWVHPFQCCTSTRSCQYICSSMCSSLQGITAPASRLFQCNLPLAFTTSFGQPPSLVFWRKPEGWYKDSFMAKAKAIFVSRGKQGIDSCFPRTGRCSTIHRKAGLHRA